MPPLANFLYFPKKYFYTLKLRKTKKKKIKNRFAHKNFVFKNFFYIVLESQNQSSSKVTFYVLSNNFFYTEIASAYVPDNTDAFFLFLL